MILYSVSSRKKASHVKLKNEASCVMQNARCFCTACVDQLTQTRTACCRLRGRNITVCNRISSVTTWKTKTSVHTIWLCNRSHVLQQHKLTKTEAKIPANQLDQQPWPTRRCQSPVWCPVFVRTACGKAPTNDCHTGQIPWNNVLTKLQI